ncbi:hypothetical protein [Ferrovibrio sp.]|uniref:hypothetical protein n=1 Tax=Ferrovibrio sp. TaxID=1917215 RepID=UPI0035198395
MHAVSLLPPGNGPDTGRRLWLAVLASLLLHLLLVLLLLAQPWTWRLTPPAPPPIEMVFPEPPKPPAPKAEPPRETPAPIPLPPPAVPQLQRAPVAEESQAPPAPGDRARSRAPVTEPAKPAPEPPKQPGPAPRATERPAPARPQPEAQAGNRQAGTGAAAGPGGPVMTQSESDFFLAQIVNGWVIDFQAPQFKDVELAGSYVVLPDGMLGPPFGKNDPWDMRAMMGPRWDTVKNDPAARDGVIALETFFRAMRLAQPFAMPPDATGYPKRMLVRFRISDITR